MSGEAQSGFHFLYRTDQGRIDRARWIAAAAPLVIGLAVGTAILSAALPYANRTLDERVFYDPLAFAANAYIVAYAFALLLTAISWVNLAAKRFRDRGRPAPLGLAGLLPLAVLVAGAVDWLQPRVADIMPRWSVWGCEAAQALIALWTLAELLDVVSKAPRR